MNKIKNYKSSTFQRLTIEDLVLDPDRMAVREILQKIIKIAPTSDVFEREKQK